MRVLSISLCLAAAPTLAAEPIVSNQQALPQPILPGSSAAAQDVPGFLWWAGPAERDIGGPPTLADALRPVPGLVIGAAPGNGTQLLAVHHGRARPGLLLAGAPLPASAALGLFDVDLLLATGPAALFQGSAGTLAHEPRRPGNRLSGAGEFAAGAFGSRQGVGRLDVPVTKGVSLGLSGHWTHDLGWLRNTTTNERLNRGTRAGLSAMLNAEVTPALSWQLTVAGLRNRQGNLPGFTCDPNLPTRCDGRFASTGQRGELDGRPDAGWGAIGSDLAGQPLGQQADLLLYASRAMWDAGRISLTLDNSLARQTGRLGLDLADGRRLDALAQPAGLASGGLGLIARTREQVERHQLALTGRWGIATLKIGAALDRVSETRRQADTEAGIVLADRLIRQTSEEQSLFGSAQLTPLKGLELSAGLRAARADVQLSVDDLRPGCAPCLLLPGTDRQRRTLVTPEFTLGWRPGGTGPVLLFARSVRSARLPGWNLLARDSEALAALPAETGWHHEAGVKLDSADGRLRLNAAAFTARTRALVSPLLGVDPLAAVAAADMSARGIDVAAQARPLPQLELGGTLALQRVRWAGAVPAGAPERPLFAPDVAAGVQAAWRQPLVGAGANLVPRIGLDWRSAMAVAAGDVISADGKGVLPGGIAPGGWQVSAALQLEIPDGGWLMSLECSNCLDQTLVDSAVAGLPVPNRPRWWRLRFNRRF